MHQPSTMWGRSGGVWVCGGLILSLQYHICINCQLCGVKLGVYAWVELGVCGCVEGEYRHFNITYASTVNYVGSNWRCVGVWRVNTVTSTSHASTVNYVGSNWRCVGVWWVNTVTSTSHASTVNYVGSNWRCTSV